MSQKTEKGKRGIFFGDQWKVKKLTGCKTGGSLQDQKKYLIQDKWNFKYWNVSDHLFKIGI